MINNFQNDIGVALKTVNYKHRHGLVAEQAIKIGSFIGFVGYLNKSRNWLRVNDGWQNITKQLIITNGKKGFILHRIH